LRCVIVAIFVFGENNNDEDKQNEENYIVNENTNSEEDINIYHEMLKIIEKNNSYYNKFNERSNFSKTNNKSVYYAASSPIPIKLNK
jgi:hypothetical protein